MLQVSYSERLIGHNTWLPPLHTWYIGSMVGKGGISTSRRETRGSNDRVHDKACKKINHISTITYSIIMQ